MVIRRSNDNIIKKTIINSSEIVPGDLIEITNNLIVPADVLLIYGSCVVNDNFSSDEDSTSTKISIDKTQNINLNEVENVNLLLQGNKVLYTLNHINEGCFGLVTSIGFSTKRGKGIRQKLINQRTN